LPDTF